MLSKAETLKGYKLDSLDGEIGEVKEFYFDDRHWIVRYLVANTGNWLAGRQVLISPYALVAAIKAKQHRSRSLPGTTRPGCMIITSARDTGTMNRWSRNIPIE